MKDEEVMPSVALPYLRRKLPIKLAADEATKGMLVMASSRGLSRLAIERQFAWDGHCTDAEVYSKDSALPASSPRHSVADTWRAIRMKKAVTIG